MALFRCASGGGAGGTITVTYSSSFYNKTMTCSNGTKTYTKTTTSSGSTEFKVSDEGTWTITCNSVSRTVNVVLNYSVAMMITKTVTVYGAVGATISFTDAVGSKTVTLNNSGQGSVSISFIPPSQTITFTDTNKAKNPNNLSQNFTKNINITESTSSVDVMPVARSKMLYWWGWKSSNFTLSAAGAAGYTRVAPTENTNNIFIQAYLLQDQMSAIGANVAVNASTFHFVGIVPSDGRGNGYCHCGTIATPSTGFTSITNLVVFETTLSHKSISVSGSLVPIAVVSSPNTSANPWDKLQLNAMWYE